MHFNSNGITVHAELHTACRRGPAYGNLRPGHGASEVSCSFSSLRLYYCIILELQHLVEALRLYGSAADCSDSSEASANHSHSGPGVETQPMRQVRRPCTINLTTRSKQRLLVTDQGNSCSSNTCYTPGSTHTSNSSALRALCHLG